MAITAPLAVFPLVASLAGLPVSEAFPNIDPIIASVLAGEDVNFTRLVNSTRLVNLTALPENLGYTKSTECQRADLPECPDCLLVGNPKQAITCLADQERWYFDLKQEKCIKFSYGGCGGSDNMFQNETACLGKCSSYITSE